MDPMLLSSHRVSLVQGLEFPVCHDLPVVGSVPFGKFPGKEREIVLTHDLRGFNPQITRVHGVAEQVVAVQVFDDHALREMLDQATVQPFALPQLLLCQPASAPCLRLLNGALPRGRKAFEAVFEEVIGCAREQTPHRFFLAHGTGNQDHGHVRSCLLRVGQGGDRVVARQVVVAKDEIERFLHERGFEPVLRAYQDDVAGHAFGVQLVADHFSVPRAILQMEHPEWSGHIWELSLIAAL